MTGRDRFDGEFDRILPAARAGESWALERIFEALSPVVAGYLRLQGCREPDDLASEVFIGVLRNIASFEGTESQFRSWVFTIAHRRLIDERRRAAKEPPSQPLSEDVDHRASDDVQEEVAERLSAQRIAELSQQLSPDQRDVVLLRILSRLSVEEVAAALSKTRGAVRVLQHRGLLAIGRLIEQEGVIL